MVGYPRPCTDRTQKVKPAPTYLLIATPDRGAGLYETTSSRNTILCRVIPSTIRGKNHKPGAFFIFPCTWVVKVVSFRDHYCKRPQRHINRTTKRTRKRETALLRRCKRSVHLSTRLTLMIPQLILDQPN